MEWRILTAIFLAFHLASSLSENVETSIYEDEPADDTTSFITLGDSKYMSTITLNAHYFTFMVQAESNAKIALLTRPGQTDSDAYIIELGADDNKKTTIGKVGGEPKSVDTEGILSASEARAFWITMENNQIQIGRELALGDLEIIEIETSDAHLITSVALTSGNEKEAHWSFSTVQGHEFIQETSTGDTTEYTYTTWMTAHNAKSIVFQVQSSSDAMVLLSNKLQDTSKVYEFGIGLSREGWTTTVIREAINGADVVSKYTTDILSDNEYRTFWISWEDDRTVQVGYGHRVNANFIVSLTNDAVNTTQISAIAMTSGTGCQASWRISSFQVNNFKVETPMDGDQSQVWIYQEAPQFEFYLRARDFAAVYLTEEPLNADNNATKGYEVAFDTSPEMAGVHIKKNPGGQILTSSKRNDIIDGLVKRKFWLSWSSDTIRVGRGTLFENEIVSYKLSGGALANVRAIALSTTRSSHMGHWEFSRYSGTDVVITTEAKTQNVAPRHWLDLTDTSNLAFKVKSCEGVSLLLADIAGSPFVEIIIGDTEDPPNKIINLVIGDIIDSDVTKDVLTCDIASWMWLSWDNERITIGGGADIGGSVFLEWTDENRKQIQSFAFRGLKKEPVFEFTTVPNRYYEVQTPSVEDFQTVWLAMQGNYFVFDVKAAANAMIILKETPKVESTRAIVVILGDEENTKSVIYRAEHPDDRITAPGPLLDSKQFMSFYIHWETIGSNRFVTVFRRDLNRQIFLFDDSADPIEIYEISIQSQPVTATWRFPDNTAMVKTFYTNVEYELDQVLHRVADTYSFVFKVMAKADAHVVLFDHYHAKEAYEIVFGSGGNYYTIIRNQRGTNEQAGAITKDILKGTSYNEFWISWKDGHIEVGYGRLPGLQRIVDYQDPDPTSVSYIALTTGWGSDGYYQIHTIPDGTFMYTTTPSTNSEQLTIRLNPTMTMYGFYVRACSDAVVLLRTLGPTSDEVYRLVMGHTDNSLTKLFDSNGNIVAQSVTPYILNCLEGRVFHLSWARHQLKLMEWNAGGRVLFEYNENNNMSLTMADIHSLSMWSNSTVPAEWAVYQYEGRQLQYWSGPSLGNTQHCCLWETVQDRTFITLSVKACSHISLLLSANPGKTTAIDTFEVVIGVDGGNRHEIRRGVNGDVLVWSSAPDLLSCTEHRTFWVSWADTLTSGYISVGKGTSVASQQIMTYKNEEYPVTIGAYSVSSEDQNTADFRLGISAAANEYNVYTPDEVTYSHAVIAPHSRQFIFAIKSCNDAHIFLQTEAFQSDSGYEIVLGGYGNTGSDIRNGKQGGILDNHKEEVLNCDGYKRFWISWHDGIRVGKGIFPGLGQILSHTGDPVHQVYSASLSTGYDADGQWTWPVQSEDLVRLSFSQQDTAERKFQWVAVSGFTEIILRIRACEDASIALADVLGNTNTASEIRLGVHGNTAASIHEKYGGDADTEIPIADSLSCDEFRTFWIRWTSMSISVGIGSNFHQEKFIEYSARNNFPPIHALGLASSDKSPIDWELIKMYGETVSIRTPSFNEMEPYKHLIVTPKYQSISFRLRTCSEGALSLRPSAEEETTPGYEIVININDQSILKRFPDSNTVAEGPFIPSDCDNYRSYWTSWANGIIRFGSGTVRGELELMSYEDPNPHHVAAVALGSLSEHPGHWEIKAELGDKYRFYTYHHDYLNSPQLSVLGMTSVVINVQTCAGARLTVSTIHGVVGTLTHEVILGDNGNKQIVIYDRSANKFLASTKMENVVSCNESRSFWLSWAQGHLRVGKGIEVGSEELLEFEDSLKDVTSLSLATWDSIVGIWDLTFPDEQHMEGPADDTTAVKTLGDSKYTTTIMLNAHYFVFHVKAGRNAKIALTTRPGQTDSDAYIVELGADDNKKTTIGKVGGEPISVDTEGILSESEARAFWITMENNQIQIGKEMNLGTNKIINIEALTASFITSVSLTSGNVTEAQWSFATVTGHEIIQETSTGSTEYEYSSWLSMHASKTFIFQVRTGKNANILISNDWQQKSSTFEVVIGLDSDDKVVIRKDGKDEKEMTHLGIITDQQYRTFWISWQDDRIAVGLGHLTGNNEILALDNVDTTQIQAVAVTSGKESQASWRISSFTANNFKVETPTDGQQSPVWIYHESNFFEFYVRASDFATVYLTAEPLNGDNREASGYEITFEGYSYNTGVYIRENPGGLLRSSKRIADVISSLVKRKFWISWHTGTGELRVGTGNFLENEIIAHSLSPGKLATIRAIALSTTGSSHMGHWEFSRYAGSDIVITSEAKTQNVAPRHWLDLTDTSNLAFKVKSCEGVSLLLADIAGSPFVEIIIGDTEDPPNKIINLVNGDIIDSDDTKDVLTCDIASWMWLSWDNERITIGGGADIGGTMLLEWTDENRKQIQSLAFRGLTKEPAFEFTKVPNLYYEVQTPSLDDFQTVWLSTHSNFFTFDVKVSSYATIILKEKPDDDTSRAIFIVLGDENNSRSVIYRVDNPEDKIVYEGPILDENQFISFFINWESYGSLRYVTVYRQDSNSQLLRLDNSADPLEINEISIQSQPNTATWRFPDDSALVKTFYTSTEYQLDQVFRRVAGLYTFVFKVRAKADAHVVLFDHNHDERAYEIVFGSAGNQWTIIRDLRQTYEKVNAYTPDILDGTKYKEFWVSWKDGHIATGYGRLPGYQQIVEYRDNSPISVSYLSLTTGFKSPGWYQIHSIPDGTFLHRTTPETDEEEFTIRLNPTMTMYDFYVRTCRDAIILLKVSGATSDSVYRLVIGGSANTVTTLYDPSGGQLHQASTPDILSCVDGKVFHLSWAQHQLRLLDVNAKGRVRFAYDEPASNMRLTTGNIHSLTMLSRTSVPAEWAVYKYEGRQLQYKTGPSMSNAGAYCCLWETVQDRTFITLSVRACSDVSVLLAVNPGMRKGEDAFEVVIGVDGGNRHEIRRGVNGDVLVWSSAPDLLSCTEHRTFWVSWSDTLTSGYISVGKGTSVASQQIMTYKNEDYPITIGAYSVSSEDQNIADFRLGTSTIVNEFNVYTPDDYKYTHAVIAKRDQSFIFSVKGCNDAHILLQSDPFVPASAGYEIVLGGYNNGGSDIRNGSLGHILVSNHDPALDCDRFMSFWVSWHNGIIRVGRGIFEGEREFLAYTGEPLHLVHSLSLSAGFGSDAQWRWPVQYEDLVRLSFPIQKDNQFQWVSVPGFFEIMIRIRACEDVSIALADVLGTVNSHAAEIRIGSNSNRESSIHELYGGEAEVTQPTENILSCDEFRTFWIRWSSTYVIVGQGGRFLEGQIMAHTTENGLPSVHAIGMSSSSLSAIDWELVKIIGDTVSIRTPSFNEETDTYKRMIVTPKESHVTFRVRTCLEGGLSLRANVDAEMSPGYEIVIDRDQRSELIRLPSEELVAESPVIPSDCDHYRSYWTSWQNSSVRFGAGIIPEMLELMQYTDSSFNPVSAVSVGSLNDHSAHWEFVLSQGDSYRFYTYHHDYQNSPQISVLGITSIVFNVKACAGARLTISTIAGMTGALAHEVILGDTANQQVVILDRATKTVLQYLNKNNVISCDESRTFWLSWAKGHLRVGTGSEIESNELLGHPDSLRDVTSLSLATWEDIVGVWDITFPELQTSTTTVTVASTTTVTVVPPTSATGSTDMPTSTTEASTTTVTVVPPTSATGSTDMPTSTTEVQKPNPGGGAGGLSAGETVGIVFGVIFAIILIGVLIFLAERKIHKRGIETTPLVFRNSQYDDNVEMAHTGALDNNAFHNQPSYTEPDPLPRAEVYDIPSPHHEPEKNIQSSDFGALGANGFEFNSGDSSDAAFDFGGDSDDEPPVMDIEQKITGDHKGEVDV